MLLLLALLYHYALNKLTQPTVDQSKYTTNHLPLTPGYEEFTARRFVHIIYDSLEISCPILVFTLVERRASGSLALTFRSYSEFGQPSHLATCEKRTERRLRIPGAI